MHPCMQILCLSYLWISCTPGCGLCQVETPARHLTCVTNLHCSYRTPHTLCTEGDQSASGLQRTPQPSLLSLKTFQKTYICYRWRHATSLLTTKWTGQFSFSVTGNPACQVLILRGSIQSHYPCFRILRSTVFCVHLYDSAPMDYKVKKSCSWPGQLKSWWYWPAYHGIVPATEDWSWPRRWPLYWQPSTGPSRISCFSELKRKWWRSERQLFHACNSPLFLLQCNISPITRIFCVQFMCA